MYQAEARSERIGSIQGLCTEFGAGEQQVVSLLRSSQCVIQPRNVFIFRRVLQLELKNKNILLIETAGDTLTSLLTDSGSCGWRQQEPELP